MHLPVSWVSISTHEQNVLGIAVPVQRRQVAQLRIVVGNTYLNILLLVIRLLGLVYQRDEGPLEVCM